MLSTLLYSRTQQEHAGPIQKFEKNSSEAAANVQIYLKMLLVLYVMQTSICRALVQEAADNVSCNLNTITSTQEYSVSH